VRESQINLKENKTMALTGGATKALPLHDLINVNTVLGMLYDENGVYRAAFEPSVFYNTILLDTLKYGEENYVHLKYAETINIRRGETVARFRRWAGMTPTLRPLKEGIPPAPDKHAYETIEIGNVFSFGRWSEYTDKIDMSIISDVVSERSLQYGENANQTKELYARKTWLASPNEFYANFKDFASLGFGDEVTLDDLRFLISRMKRMLVKPIGGKFLYVCSTEFINGLIDDPRVKQYMAIEQTTGKLWGSGEPFDMFELSFIPTMLDEFAYPDTEYPGVYELSTGKEVIRLYAISGNTVYYMDVHEDFQVIDSPATPAKVTGSGVEYLRDGTAVENHAVWEFPITADALDANSVIGTGTPVGGSGSTGKVLLRKSTRSYELVNGVMQYTYTAMVDASADFAAVNTLVDAGAFMQLPIHRGILFGMEALVKINVEGLSDAPQIIIKALGSSGVADPINQRQSVGYKVDGFGLAIKRPEAICITYGIPKFAELAALSNKVISGNWELMDGLKDDDSVVNTISATDGAGVLRVDAVNDPRYVAVPNEPIVMGTGEYPIFSASVNYAIGDKVLYNNIPYVFTATHTAASWNVAHVAKASQFNTLEDNPLDNGGNDDESNVK
jgi:hypothetical protein